MRNRNHLNLNWSPELSYAIGIITSDGNLSPDGRHLNITSKDKEIPLKMRSILNLRNKIGMKSRGGEKEKKYYVLQFGNIGFYEFLLSIGLTPAKSKTLQKVEVPDKYFADFLRGCIDGDGSIGYNMHPESKHPQWKIRLYSASPIFLSWMHEEITKHIKISGGHIYTPPKKSPQVLSFGNSDTRKIINFMYYRKRLPALERKYKIAQECLNGRVA